MPEAGQGTAEHLRVLTTFFADLQRLTEIAKVLETGLGVATDEQVRSNVSFLAVKFEIEREWELDEARLASQRWLQTRLMQDLMDLTGTFLEECLTACEVLSRDAPLKEDELCRLRKRHNDLNFPTKVEWLKTRYGFKGAQLADAQTLNALRNCLVHRDGIVADKDVGSSGSLSCTLLGLRMVLQDAQGQERVLEGPQVHVPEGQTAKVTFQHVSATMSFPVGSQVVLGPFDVVCVLLTLGQMGMQCSEDLSAWAATQQTASGRQQG